MRRAVLIVPLRLKVKEIERWCNIKRFSFFIEAVCGQAGRGEERFYLPIRESIRGSVRGGEKKGGMGVSARFMAIKHYNFLSFRCLVVVL